MQLAPKICMKLVLDFLCSAQITNHPELPSHIFSEPIAKVPIGGNVLFFWGFLYAFQKSIISFDYVCIVSLQFDCVYPGTIILDTSGAFLNRKCK